MLTPEQIQKLDAGMGLNTQAGVPSGPTTRAEEIMHIGQQAQQAQAPQQEQQGYIDSLGSSYMNRAKNIVSDVQQPAQEAQQGASPLKVAMRVGEAGLRTAGNVAGAVLDPLTVALQKVFEGTPKLGSPGIGSAGQSLPNKTEDTSSDLPNQISDWAAKHPNASKDLQAVMDIAGLLGTGESKLMNKPLSEISQGAKSTLETIPSKVKGVFAKSPEASLDKVLESVSPKLSKAEEIAAKASGRGTTEGKLFKKTVIQPQARDLEMAQYAQEAGVNGKEAFDEQIAKMKYSQKNSFDKVRSGLEKSDAIWNQNELKGAMDKVEKPITVKSDATLNRTVNNFKKAALQLAEDANKKHVGLLDVRQGVDELIQREFPKNIYTKDTPIGQYVRNFRRAINDLTESKLPDGKLPTGESIKAEWRKENLLYDAIDNVAEKAPRIGESNRGILNKATKFAKKHPIITTGIVGETGRKIATGHF